MANPSSPELILSLPAMNAKKPQPIPWTHQETVNLIRAYQEKWYSLKRGPLRSSQWEEVAVVVADRCGSNTFSKSALQCRHKMEKLRQRHRSEKHRLSAAASSSAPRSWQYLGLMDELERGPGPLQPILARPIASVAARDVADDDERGNRVKSRTRSINSILLNQRPTTTHVLDEDDGDEEEEEEEEGVLASGLTAEIRDFAESIIWVENLKMEMMKETERFRLEMEKKRIGMILESQWKIVDSIGKAFGSSKRTKVSHPSLL